MPTINVTTADNLQTIIDALSNPGPSNVYDIVLADGIYENQGAEHDGLTGLMPRDYVNLRSASENPDTCEIRGTKTDGFSTPANYETISLRPRSVLSGLTITCRNMRYPIHVDHKTNGIANQVENCVVEHYGCWSADGSRYATSAECAWNGFHAIGCSLMAGSSLDVIGSKLTGRKAGAALYAHDYWNVASGAAVSVSDGMIVHADGGAAVMMISLGAQQTNICTLNRTQIAGAILVEDVPWLGSAKNDHSEWLFSGSGNTYDHFWNNIQGGTQFAYRWADPSRLNSVRNASGVTIPAKSVCCFVDGIDVRLMTSADAPHLFDGVAVANIAPGAVGNVIASGHMTHCDLLLPATVFTPGTPLGIDPSNPGRLVVSDLARGVVTYIGPWAWWSQYMNDMAYWGYSFRDASVGLFQAQYQTAGPISTLGVLTRPGALGTPWVGIGRLLRRENPFGSPWVEGGILRRRDGEGVWR